MTAGQWLQFDARVGEMEELLFAKYYVFKHLETEVSTVACPE